MEAPAAGSEPSVPAGGTAIASQLELARLPLPVWVEIIDVVAPQFLAMVVPICNFTTTTP